MKNDLSKFQDSILEMDTANSVTGGYGDEGEQTSFSRTNVSAVIENGTGGTTTINDTTHYGDFITSC